MFFTITHGIDRNMRAQKIITNEEKEDVQRDEQKVQAMLTSVFSRVAMFDCFDILTFYFSDTQHSSGKRSRSSTFYNF